MTAMKQSVFEITENRNIAERVFLMRLSGDDSEITRPGQFVNIRVGSNFLRRPISVCDSGNGALTLVYKTVGAGTAEMSRLAPGEKLDILTGLGNGYDLTRAGDSPLLIGGGAGVPPLYKLARELIKAGKSVKVILGFNTANEVFFVNEFGSLGAKVFLAVADGTAGKKGFVTDLLDEAGDYTYFYTCGPEPMLKAVYAKTETSGQFSFEERMGCGFGACMGCTCRTVTGYKRICRDGPVLYKEEILWK